MFSDIDAHCWLMRVLFLVLCKFSGFRGGTFLSFPPLAPPLVCPVLSGAVTEYYININLLVHY